VRPAVQSCCTASALLLNKAEKNVHLKINASIHLTPSEQLAVALSKDTLEIEGEFFITFCIEHFSPPLESGEAVPTLRSEDALGLLQPPQPGHLIADTRCLRGFKKFMTRRGLRCY